MLWFTVNPVALHVMDQDSYKSTLICEPGSRLKIVNCVFANVVLFVDVCFVGFILYN